MQDGQRSAATLDRMPAATVPIRIFSDGYGLRPLPAPYESVDLDHCCPTKFRPWLQERLWPRTRRIKIGKPLFASKLAPTTNNPASRYRLAQVDLVGAGSCARILRYAREQDLPRPPASPAPKQRAQASWLLQPIIPHPDTGWRKLIL